MREDTIGREREMEKKVEEAEKGREEERKKAAEGVIHTPPPSNTPPITPIAFNIITSLD